MIQSVKTSPEPSGKPTTWWWIRHAPVPFEYSRFVYGSKDVPADVSNTGAFAALAEILPVEAHWVVSPLQRTHMTMDAIGAARVAAGGPALPEPEVVPDFIEQSFGDWQGRERKELYAEIRKGPDKNRFWLTAADKAPPGGESFVDLCRRVGAEIERLSRAHAGGHVISAGHGGTIRGALALALALEPARVLHFQIDNLSVTRIDRFDDGGDTAWRVATCNAHPSLDGWNASTLAGAKGVQA